MKEILERKAEIRTELRSDSRIEKPTMDAFEEELRNLEKEEQEIRQRMELAAKINTGEEEGRELPNPAKEQPGSKTSLRSMQWDQAIETEEYRTIWAKDMMGQSLTAEERETLDHINDEYREFTHTTENTQILIPKTVADG
ncbi:hypothetical protein V4V35_25970, partial [Bacillus infantis]